LQALGLALTHLRLDKGARLVRTAWVASCCTPAWELGAQLRGWCATRPRPPGCLTLRGMDTQLGAGQWFSGSGPQVHFHKAGQFYPGICSQNSRTAHRSWLGSHWLLCPPHPPLHSRAVVVMLAPGCQGLLGIASCDSD
jgi:hypothetical protein